MTLKKPGRSINRPEVAFYYPGPIWRSGDWIKNLILFFDGIALLVPNYMKDKPEHADPAITLALKEKGLLHILEPEIIVDKKATKKLADSINKILSSGALDALSKEETAFHEISYSRLGGYGDHELADDILSELKKRGLARDTEDGLSIPVHPLVRALILVLLAQILRGRGDSLGLELSPATDRPALVDALAEILSIPETPSAGHLVTFDLKTVGIDLSSIPMDEVLSFRKENHDKHKKYVYSVRKFIRELSRLPENERDNLFEERQSELNEIARDLRSTARKAWKRPAWFALTAAGAAWTIKTGDPIGAILGAGTGLLGATLDDRAEAGAYSYIFAAKKQFPW